MRSYHLVKQEKWGRVSPWVACVFYPLNLIVFSTFLCFDSRNAFSSGEFELVNPLNPLVIPVQPIEVFSVCHLHAPPPDRSVPFAVAGPSIWNCLPLSIRSLPRTLSQTFLSQFKAVLFGRVGVGSASE